ncbi:transglycosylase domain-containing protein [Actinosynnema sp. NPDC020468]|uniref:transglycosylase domain-containing protein n=1 Tax=Actinosynnema sp. NPDC020468 TaxID=3154488 RepID=UPI00340EF92B
MGGPGGPGGPRRPGGPERRPGEEPTDLLPSVHHATPREPDLLTHREDELAAEPVYDEDEYDDEDEPTETEAKAMRRKKIWRRVRRTSYVLLGLMILAPVVAFAIAYQVVEVPVPEQVAAEQNKAINILYSDGSPMTKIAPDGANRTMIKYEDLPDTVKHAVYAAEDPTFEENPGFDFTAIARAGWYQVTGRDSGGSGLTQQYVKQATKDDSPTLSRKFTEIVKAYKMSKQQDKNDILTAYLNTIYFGRSAYGIKEAAKVYFNKDLKDLTQSEAALIAGMIQNPGRSEQPKYTLERWEYVMGQLVKFHWADQSYKDTEKFPAMRPLADLDQGGIDGTRLYIKTQILNELEKIGYDMARAQQVGATIYTTIDPGMQTAAEQVIDNVMTGQPEKLTYSMSAIDPTSGAVKVYWAGKDGNGIDYQKGTLQEPGSSFKPFDFVAALQKGEGAGTTYDGSSPRSFPGRGDVSNSPGVACKVPKQCSVREAMVKSVNTVFYDMVVNNTGTQKVADAAHQAGIPDEVEVGDKKYKMLVGENGTPPDGNISIGGGLTQVRPFDMTSAYATFASRGVYHEPFFISKIVDADGTTVHQHIDKSKAAFSDDPQESQDIADNVTDVLKDIPKAQARTTCAGGRACAGKTGTQERANTAENSKAWMVGYTPTLSVGVYMGTEGGVDAIKDKGGSDIYGSGLPGMIWKQFMDRAMDGQPLEPFAKPNPIGQFEEPVITPTTTVPPKTTTPKETTTTTTPEPTTTTTEPPTKPTTTKPCNNPITCTQQPPVTSTTDPVDPIGGGGKPTR